MHMSRGPISCGQRRRKRLNSSRKWLFLNGKMNQKSIQELQGQVYGNNEKNLNLLCHFRQKVGKLTSCFFFSLRFKIAIVRGFQFPLTHHLTKSLTKPEKGHSKSLTIRESYSHDNLWSNQSLNELTQMLLWVRLCNIWSPFQTAREQMRQLWETDMV